MKWPRFEPGGWGSGGNLPYDLYGDVQLDRVWFFTPPALNKVYNFKLVWPNQGLNLS